MNDKKMLAQTIRNSTMEELKTLDKCTAYTYAQSISSYGVHP